MKIQLLFFLCTLLTISCAQEPPSKKPANDKKPYMALPMQEKIPSTDVDPYFTETTTITGDTGPRSITRNIIQDRKGDFWFASWEGIVGYDGKKFTNYTNKNRLRRFHMFSALQDSKGGYWFGSIRAGLYRYDGEEFVNITVKDGLPGDMILCFYEDSKGRIWIGTDGGIAIFDGEGYTSLTKKDGMLNTDVNSIVEDESGKFYIGSRGEMQVYEDGKFSEFAMENGESFINVRSVIIDGSDRIWLGGNNGLWVIDGVDFTQLSKDFVGYIFEDSKGVVWVGSVESGVRNWKLKKCCQFVVNYFSE